MKNQYKKVSKYNFYYRFLFALLTIISFSNEIEAQVRVPFTQRTSQYSPTKKIYNVRGDFTMVGNTNLTLQNYGDLTSNSSNSMIYVDKDSDPNTWNSSSSTLGFSTENGAIPSCSNIIYAGLYWTGRASDSSPSNTTFSVTKNMPIVSTINNNLNVGNGIAIANTTYTLNITRGGTTNDRNPIYTFISGVNTYVFNYTNNTGVATITLSINGGIVTNVPVSIVTSGTTATATLTTPYVITNGLVSLTIKSLVRSTAINLSLANTQTTSSANVNVSGTITTTGPVTKNFDKTKILLKGPGASAYTQFTANASDIYYPTTTDGYMYSAYKEVTDYVKTNGIGDYFAADMALIEGNGGTTGYYGGWGLIVVYENSKMKYRDVTIFDGHAYVASGTSSYELPISGFNASQAGPIGMKIGVIAGEGDNSVTGDYFQIQKLNTATFLSLNHSGNTIDNFFNSSIQTGGNARNPSLLNNTGLDISMFSIPNTGNTVIANSQTSTKFKYGSTGDTYIIFAIAMAIDAYIPDPELISTVSSINGIPVSGLGPFTVLPGQEIEYKIKLYNEGTEALNLAKITIPISYTSSYVTGSAVRNIYFTPLPTPNNLSFNPLIGANGTLIWDIGTLPLPANPGVLLGDLTYRIKVTENCSILKNTNCQPNVTLYGGISGVSAVTNVVLGDKPIIQGYTVSGACQGEAITSPLIINISSLDYVNQNCNATPSGITFSFCNGSNTIPISQISSGFPPGTRFYNTYPVIAGSIEYTTLLPFPSNSSTTTYYAIPPGSVDCFFAFKITTYAQPTIAIGTDYVINACNNTSSITGLSYSETPISITLAEFIANGGTTSNSLLNYTISYIDTKSGSCPINVTRTFTVSSSCGVQNFTQYITVQDITPPSISAAGANATIDCPATPSFTAPTATDSCGTATINVISTVTAPSSCAGNYSVTKTWDTTDACGNHSAEVSQTITVQDITKPTASNPANIEISGCNGTFANPDITLVSDASDNCSTPVVTFVNDSSPTISGCTETTIRTYKVTDACGNFINVSQNLIRTIDSTLPTASNPANIEISGCNGTFANPDITLVSDASDNCSTPVVTFVNDSSPTISGCTETTIRTYKVTDACGNFINVSQNLIRTIDTTLPTASNPANIEISGCNGTFANPDITLVSDASDNCSTPVVTFVNDSSPTISGCTETTIRTYKVTDECGNFITVSQNLIRTIDTTLPTASNPTSIEISGCNGTFENPNISVVTDASDNCSTPNITFINDSLPTTIGCTETTIRTYKVTDACGNFITVNQNLIRTIDTTLPTASNPAAILINGCNGTFENPNIAVVTDASDNCSTPNVTFVNDSLPTTIGCTETTIRTYKVTDACENFINVTQNLIRTIDTTNPTASNPTNISISGCNGTFEIPNSAVVTDASDNCSTPNITFVNDSTPTIIGCTETTIRTYKVTDACGNFITVSQNLIRTIDTTLPTASNPNSIEISGCNGTFENPNISVVTDALDNCSTPNITFVNDSSPTIIGCTETTIRTYKVTDECGNFITVNQNLIRTIDTTLPTASNPTDISISGCNGTFENPNIAIVTDASDNCSTQNITFVNDSLPTISGCTETTIRTYKVTDECGNFITVSQNLIRTIDTTLPTASNPANIEISGCNGTFENPNIAVVSDAADNCSTPNITFVNDSAPTIIGCTETTIRTYKITDECGNFINVSQNLIRTIDTTLPMASNPANIEISGCNGTFENPDISVVADALDNCSTPNITFVNDSAPNVSGCTETTIRTYKVTDECGNFITVNQNLIRTIDTTLPTASNPANIEISGCNGTFENPNIAVVTDALDNCSTPNITFVNDSLPTIIGCTETTIRTYKVTDECGNFITVNQNLIRTIDTTLPTASNPANIEISGCNGTFENPNISVVTDALDNCSTPNITFVNDSAPTISGCTETTIRTYKITDACGNFINVTQNLIRTIDTTLPTASNPANIEIYGCNGTFENPNIAVVTDVLDNCSTPNITFVNDSAPTIIGCTETTIRTYKITDECGNFITVSQNLIRTIDTTLPTASNPANIEISGCNGTFENPNISVVTDALDNCSTPNITFLNDSLPTIIGCTETTIRTYKVTDECGNFITVNQNLIRTIDTTLPTASNPNPIEISGCNGTFENPNISVVTDALDNCSTPVVTFVNDSLPIISGCTEITVRTYRITDACGNFITVNQNLIRTIDTTLPTASNPANIEISGCNGTFANPDISVVTDASDNCSLPNITFVNDSLPTVSGCTETTIRTYKITDECGNFITVSQNLIRTIDTTLPTASNPTDISITGCNGTFENPNILVVTDASDNCSTPNITFVNDSTPTISGCTETTVRTYKVTDACGNFITVNQNLIRTIDTTLPTASNPANIEISGCNGTFENPNIAVVTDALDNCSTPNITFVNDSLPTIIGCTETTIRTYKVTDECGNFITVNQNLIRTIDTTLPTASNPANIEISGCNGTFENPNISVVTDALDNCSTPNITFVNDSAPTISGCTETTIRTYKITDACGNFINVTQNLIRTIDTTLPTASNPANIEIYGCNGTFENPNIAVVTDVLDNCSTPNITFVNDSAPTIIGCTETTIRTYKITDECGNFITVSQNLIRTIDTTLPTASNPANIEISGCNGTFENPNISVVTDALDNCSTPNITFLNDSLPTIIGCTETTIRTYKVTDECGNFITVNQNLIRTIDTTLPTASNPNPIEISGCNGTFENPNSSVVFDAFDNCSTPNITFVNDSLPSVSGCTETTIRTYKVTDECGNFITVSQKLIRTIDTTLPTASNPNPIEISGCNGTFENPNIAVVTDALDNCSTPNITFVNDSTPTISGCTETTIRTYKVTDACGNFITVSQNLIRTIDTTNPTASNPNPIEISGCNGTFENPNISVVTDALDNCSTPNITFVNDSLPTILGCTETTIRTYKVTDDCGNFITVSQNLIRTIDTTLPTASNPNPIEISGCNGTFENPNIAVVSDASDNCSTPNITFVNDSLPTISGCTETTIRTYKVTDACGNFITVFQNLIRTIDTTLPTASNPNPIVISGCNGTFENPNISVVTDALDNCSTPNVTFVNDSTPTIIGCTETTIRTYKVTDACGNFINVSHNLIRTIDTTLPTASNPTSIEISGCNGTFENPNSAVVTDALDNCSTPNVTFVNDSSPTVSGCTETTIRTYKVTDDCGNFINVFQNLIRTIDTTLPTASNPTDISISGCNGTFENPNSAVVIDALDNCSTPNITFVNDSLPSVSGCTETTIRTYKVTDECGNFITVFQNLIRTIDTTLPTASNPTDISITGCNGTFENPNSAVVTDALDNCSIPNITFVNDSTPIVSGCTETTIRTYKITDECGNFINVTQNLIRTIDTTNPTASNPTDISISGCNGTFENPNIAVVTDALDNCSTPNITFVNDSAPTISGCTETTIRTYKVADACGNFINVTQNLIRTIDTTLPTASNPTSIEILGCNGTFENPNISVVTDALDNCSTPNVTFVNDSLPSVSGCTETTIRTYKVADACGNFINVTQNLIRTIDTTLPTASNPTSIEILGCNGTFENPNISVVTDALDNCSTPNITFVNDSLPTILGCMETTIRTYKVTDDCGNFINVSQNLIRTIDTTLPTASNPNPIEISGCNGTFENPNSSVVTDALDNCSIPNITFVNDSVPTTIGCTETTIRTYKVTDACGNFINVTQNLIRTIDTTLPTFTASIPANVSVSCDEIPAAATITATDNCGNTTIEFTESRINGNCISNYILTRKWKATDSCGNFNIATQEITVSDTKAPTITGTFDSILNINCNQVPPIPTLQFTDNCSGVGTIIPPSADVLLNQTPSGYSIIREWNVSDLCGNSNIYTQTINVTIQNNLISLPEQACNGDTSTINLNDMIPIADVGLGTWVDLNNGIALPNGIFTPLGVLIGNYTFEYQINSIYCPIKIQISMTINDDCVVLACGNIIVHNAFSPNNDGLNEIFTIENLENRTCYPTNKVEIYNRWGELVYENKNYDNDLNAFKGISEGQTTIKKSDELPTGTYFYLLEFTDDQGKNYKKDGYLYLSR